LDVIGFQGTRVSGTQEFRKKIAGISRLPPGAGPKVIEFPIIRYTGKQKSPQWMDEEEGR